MIGIYVRISDDEQSQYSISDQLEECRKKAGTNEIVEYIDEGVTGGIIERPALTRLRDDVKAGLIEKVICWDPDRFSRDLMIQLLVANELEKRAELIFVNHDYKKTPEGILFFQMRGAFSQFEKAKITERTSRGRKTKAIQKKVIKNSKMYGYDYDKETSMYTINEKEAEIVRLIFDLFTKPNQIVKGINSIAKYLTEQGIPTKRGASVWHKQVVRQILLNESYTGKYYQNRWNTEGMVGNKYKQKDDRVKMKERPKEEWISLTIPQIISEFQFEHAQRLLGEARRRYTKMSKNKYLLSGLVRCGECNNTMTGRKSKNWGKYILEYIDIKSTAGAKERGCGMRMKCETLDEEVWKTVLNWLNQPEEIAASAEEEVSNSLEQTEIERMEKEIEKLRNKRKNLIKLFASMDDESEQEIVRQEMRELSENEKSLTSRIEALKSKVGNAKNQEYSKKIFMDAAEYYLTKGSDELTFEDRQELIREVVREIRVYKDRVDIFSF